MSDSADQKLSHALGELHEALQQAEALDPALERRSREVIEELQGLLQAESQPAPESPAHLVTGRLEELALEFELTHPTLADTINRVTNLLASMGI
jgi:hypothetical protein